MLSNRLARWFYRGPRPNGIARLMNIVGAALSALGIAPDYMVMLQVVGRRSGRLIAFPLVMATLGDERYLVAMLGRRAAWVHNIEASGGRALLRHGRTEQVRLEAVPVSERPPVLKRFLQRAPGARPHIPVDKDAPVEAFAAVAEQIPVFRVVAGG